MESRRDRNLITGESKNAKPTESQDIVIVGGGVAGLATALALHRVGLRCVVVERADSLRTTGAALMMWVNAWRALEALGVDDTLRANYCELEGVEGRSNYSGMKKYVQLKRQGKGNMESRCVERSALLQTLANALPEGTIRFNSKIVSIYKNFLSGSPFIRLELADGTSIRAKILIGCDGVHSVVAHWMGLQPARSTGRSAIRGMATYPQGHHLEKRMVQIWGRGVKAGFIPCTDKHVYWFATQQSVPQDAEISGDQEAIRRKAMGSVAGFPDVIADMIDRSPAESLSLMTLKLRWLWPSEWRRSQKGGVTLAGDAMHPMTPDLGQGACTSLEDAVVLGRCVAEGIRNGKIDLQQWGVEQEGMIGSCFQKYLEERRWRIFGIVCGGFVAGLVQEGSTVFLQFLRDKILFPLLSMKYLIYFQGARCGTLLYRCGFPRRM